VNSTIPKRIAEQRISNGFIGIATGIHSSILSSSSSLKQMTRKIER
jgi:hypothetical protein